MRNALAVIVTSAVFGFALRADGYPFIADSASGFAGSYWYSDPRFSMSMQLDISRDSHFNLREYGCFGSHNVNHGNVEFRDGILVLAPKLPAEQGFAFGSRAMFPVRWHDRLYLVSANRVGEFAAAIRADTRECDRYCGGFFVLESDLDEMR